MACNLYALLYHAIKQKLAIGFWPTLQNLLDDVIAIDVLAHFDEPGAEVSLDQFEVLGQLDDLEDFLDWPSSVSIFAEFQRIFLHWLNDPGQLGLTAYLCYFLK